MSRKVDFNQYTDNYNDLLKSGTEFFSENDEYFAKYKVDIVRSNLEANVKHVLEYGCGIGRNIPYLRKAFPGASIIGSDISEASLERARQEYPDVFFYLENDAFPLTKKFDLIFVAGVFHHIPPAQRLDVMSTLTNRLADNGAIYIFEHNPFNPVTRHIVNHCPYDEDAILLKPSEMIRLIQGAGLKPRRKEYCLFVPPRFSALTRIECVLSWLPLGGQYWVKAAHR